jgi:ribosomal protein S18 acetylase RimI-like enzyme
MIDTQLNIRQAQIGDEHALALVGSATFLETYAHMIPGPDMLAHCTEKHGAPFYATWLRDPTATIWLAETEVKSPVGYLLLTRATLPTEAPQPDDLEIQRIYVLNRFHRTGLGYALMNLAVSKALSRGANRLVLGVHTDNTRALAFYQRQGFAVIDGRTFTVGNSIFCDKVLARPLR